MRPILLFTQISKKQQQNKVVIEFVVNENAHLYLKQCLSLA